MRIASSHRQQGVASHAVTGWAHKRADYLLGGHGPQNIVAGCTPQALRQGADVTVAARSGWNAVQSHSPG